MANVSEQVSKNRTVRIQEMHDILSTYDLEQVCVGVLASHSALDLADGAKEEGLPTLAVCERRREKTYSRYNRIIDETLILDDFGYLIREDNQKKLRNKNIIFVPNRSLTAYIPVEKIENEFQIPMFGNRYMLRADEREEQEQIFIDAHIPHPYRFTSYKDIDRLCMVKAKEPKKKIERAFFTAASPNEFLTKWQERFGTDLEALEKQLQTGETWIEEYVLGAQFNFNYFYSPIDNRVEFLGIDRRIQTNLDGLLRLPADDQVGRKINPEYIEIGHESATIRESRLEDVYDLGEKFVTSSKRLYSPHGIIGPFALQGAVTPDLKIVIYDLSPRMPGSPVLYNSPYSKYFFGYPVTSGRRVAMEIKKARDTNQLDKIIT